VLFAEYLRLVSHDALTPITADHLDARYYQMYSDILLPIYPGIVNPDLFEAELQVLLDDRDRIIASADEPSHPLHPHDASWFALLFGVLACGAQCLSTMENEAELNSKVFGMFSSSNLSLNG